MKCVISVLPILIMLRIVQTQFVASDQAIIDDVELVSYSKPLSQPDTQYSDKITIFFTQKKFQKIPKIIVGFKTMDYDYNSVSKSFEILYDSVTTDSFQMQFLKYKDTKVYRIVATYIAIESDDVFSNSVSLSFSPWPSNNQVTLSTPFQRQTIDTTQTQRKAFGFIQALKSDGVTVVKRHKIQMGVSIGSSSVDVKVIQDDPDKSLNQIKVNYLEFYTSIANPYYDVRVINDNTYLASMLMTIGNYSASTNLDYNYKMDMSAVSISLTSFDIPVNQFSGRLDVSKISYSGLSAQLLSYQYSIWVDSQAYMFAATLGVLKMKDCSAYTTSPINHSAIQQCVANCPLGYSQQKRDPSQSFSYCQKNPCSVANCLQCDQNGLCIQCNASFYLYQQACYTQQLPKTYCDSSLNCYDCLAACSSCSDGSTCTACQNGYLFSGNCQTTKPNNTYCDKNKICKACSNPTCSNCDQSDVCISCSVSQPYYYINQCYSTKQLSTYCDEQKICFQCHPLCLECSGPNNNQCISCDTTYYKLNNNKCECLTSGYGFDINTYSCVLCSKPLCGDCYGDNTQCVSCLPEAVFNTKINQCECSDPLKYYNTISQLCVATTVKNCKISSKTKNECAQCQDGYFYDQLTKQCTYCQNKVFADSQNSCQLNCRKNCMTCVNSTDCIVEMQIDNNSNPSKPNPGVVTNCHFSCDQCSQPNSPTSCTTCASPSTRSFDGKTSLCSCKVNYMETNQINCAEVDDLDSSIEKTVQITTYIALGIQSLFIFGLNSPHYQYIIILQQYLYLLTYYPDFNSTLQFYKIFNSFKYYSYFALFENIQLFSQASYSLNLLIIFTIVLVVTTLIGLSFHFANFSLAYKGYFRWNLIFLISRLLSLYSFLLIFKLLLRDQKYNDTLTISITSSFIFFYLLKIALHIRGIWSESTNGLRTNSNSSILNNSQSINLKIFQESQMEKPSPMSTPNSSNQEIEMISTFQQRVNQKSRKKKKITISPYESLFSEFDMQITLSKYFWLLVDFRNIAVAFVIGYFGNQIWAYYTIPSISFAFIVILSFNNIHRDSKERKLVFFTEGIIICIQIFYCFYINQINQSSDQNKILILFVTCFVFVIELSIIIYYLAIIIEYFKEKMESSSKLRLHQQNQQQQAPCSMRMQSYFTKDQINAVLDQSLYLSNQNHLRNKRRYYS